MCAKNSVIAAWLNKLGMSWESGASPCLTGTYLLIAFVTSQGETLSPRALGQEVPDVCRSRTPGDSPAHYVGGVVKSSSDCTAAPRAVLGSTTCSPNGLGHVTSSLFLSLLCPPWVRCVFWEIALPLCIGETLLLVKRALSPLPPLHLLEPAWGLCHSELTLLNFIFHSFGRRDH